MTDNVNSIEKVAFCRDRIYLNPLPHPDPGVERPERVVMGGLQVWIRRFILAVYLLLFLCVSPMAAAQSQIGKDIPLRWYEDTSAGLDIHDFMALPVDVLTEQRHVLSRGYTQSPVWLRFTLPADLFDGQDRWLQLGPNFLDHITLY